MKHQFRVIMPMATLSFVRQNKRFLTLMALVTVGVLIGSVGAGNWLVDSNVPVFQRFCASVAARAQQSYWSVVLHSVGSGLPYLLTLYAAGLFIFGTPIAASVPFLYGMGCGVACGFYYIHNGLKGVAFCLLNLIPPMFGNALLLVIAGCDALAFSRSLACCYMRNAPAVLPKQRFKQYHIRFGVYSFLFVGISLFDGLLSQVFSNVFGL